MTIKLQHQKAIAKSCYVSQSENEAAAIACERITLERMKVFAEWIGKTQFEFLPANEVWICEVNDNLYTTTELVQLYLESLEP